MVQLQEVKSSNVNLVERQALVAVVVGGTKGIGEYTIRALAATHANVGRGLRLYIIGRNTKAAEAIISDCQDVCPGGTFIFVQAGDLSLLKNIDAVCDKLIDVEQQESIKAQDVPRVDFLVMCQACPPWWSEQETSEGLDSFMSLVYYGRMRMTTRLIKLLTASSMPAHVVSVYAGGCEGQLISDDLMLRKPGHNTLAQARSHITYMTTIYMESLAEQHPGKISLCHVFPGLVVGPTFQDPDMPRWMQFLWTLLGPIISRFYAVPEKECGARIMFLATPRYAARPVGESGETQSEGKAEVALGTDGTYGSGVYAVNWNGESISVAKAYEKLGKEKISKLILEHTNQAFKQIEDGQVFKG